ncbi:MAG: type II toxin-antitoxin system VapC family toxin [Sulfuritalea sp.]|jgi:PIN domain nuclease of toxin-antitoxin system|nr:type II toxin-antitoxin system VapC family toxin [Sulfuritalea sp.]
MARLLLDTHVVLWWVSAHPRLAEADRNLIASSECFVSAASLWEVAIKFKLGKLPFGPDRLLDVARGSSIRFVPVTPEHAVATMHLPPIHGDPFDRLLIAQARQEKMELLTADAVLSDYGDAIRMVGR